MRLGRECYNALVEVENARRHLAWGGDIPPKPPHPLPLTQDGDENDDETAWCRCAECKAHWMGIREALHALPPIDTKPIYAHYCTNGPLYWGTFNHVAQAFSAAWKKTRPWRPVKYRSWRQGGVIAVQIQAGYQKRQNYDTLFRINDVVDTRTRHRHKGHHRATVQLALGAGRMTSPIEIEQHRPIVGTPTWVTARLCYDSLGRERAAVNFTRRDVPQRTDLAPRGVVAVDVSWRQVPDGLRIAWTRDDQGHNDQLVLDTRWQFLAKHADQLQAIRDQNLNLLKAVDPAFAQAKSPRHACLILAEIEDPSAVARAWRYREEHLRNYEMGERRHSVNRRRDALRKWARELRRNYAEVVVKDSQHKEMKETAKQDKLSRKARRQGQHGAPGEVIAVLREIFGDDGMWLVEAAYTTDRCPLCGHLNAHGAERIVVCEECGEGLDRDLVSTRNMLVAYAAEERRRPTARKTAARFGKRHKTSTSLDNASPAA